MKKNSKSKTKTAAVPRVDPYLEGLMGKLLERLAGLEQKMDMVIAQTAGKSPAGVNQPKPFQALQPQPPARRDRILYEAICADCHKVCEVPFKPSETRAVYCKECFAKRKSGGQGKINTAQKLFAPPQRSVPLAPTVAAPAPSTHLAPKKAKKSLPAKKTKKKK